MYNADFLALSPLSKVHMLIMLERMTSTQYQDAKKKGEEEEEGEEEEKACQQTNTSMYHYTYQHSLLNFWK